MGVGLIQYQKMGVLVHGARQGDSLALPAGQQRPLVANIGIEFFGKVLDDRGQTGLFGSRHNALGGGMWIQAGNIITHRSRQEFHILRQVTNMSAQMFAWPGEDVESG